MIISKMEELRFEKAYAEKRKLTLKVMAAETGLSINTIQRVLKNEMGKVYLSTLDTLCEYFKVDDVDQLITFKPGTAVVMAADGIQEATEA